MENDRGRVFDATFDRAKAAMHHHPDHVVHVIEGGKLKLTSDGKTDVLDLKTGDTVFLNAQTHEAVNIGETILRFWWLN